VDAAPDEEAIMIKPRIKLPDSAKAGDIIDIKTVVTHPMETGNRKDAEGKPIARNIINLFVAKFAGTEVFRVELGSGISANPYLSFSMRVPGPGQFEFSWTDDEGKIVTETAALNVAS
jgi:sulfur-oxidizing protein SoxZ